MMHFALEVVVASVIGVAVVLILGDLCATLGYRKS
jgi:hypothetical protein